MNKFILIILVFLFFESFSQTKSPIQFKAADFETQYFEGKNGKERQILTFWTDSTFHITVPNNSGSCFTWDEFGGQMQVKGDTIIFSMVGIYNEKQVFIFKDDKTIGKISPDGVMCKTYKLEKWGK